MHPFELVGFAASALTTASFVPQVWRTWKTRSTGDMSDSWLLMFSTGIALWLAYGLWLVSWPIIFSNALTLLLLCAIIWVKFAPGPAPETAPIKESA